MTKRTITEEDRDIRIKRAQEWQDFREKYKFSQKMLADTLKSIDVEKPGKRPGVSRRTIQAIEAALITPHQHTLDLFNELKSRHERNRAA